MLQFTNLNYSQILKRYDYNLLHPIHTVGVSASPTKFRFNDFFVHKKYTC